MDDKPTLLISRLAHQAVGARAMSAIEMEARKGCSGEIYPYPVELEPPYQPLSIADALETTKKDKNIPLAVKKSTKKTVKRCHKLWLHPEDEYDESRFSTLFESLSSLPERSSLECCGNRHGVHIQLFTGFSDTQFITDTIKATFPLSEVRQSHDELAKHIGKNLRFYEFFPARPPYNKALVYPESLSDTPLALLFQCLSNLPESAFGFYHVIFQPVQNDWKTNMRVTSAVEKYNREGISSYNNFLNDAPLTTKDPNFSKLYSSYTLFAVCIRAGIFSVSNEKKRRGLENIKQFVDFYRYGDHQLQYITDKDFKKKIKCKPADIVARRDTYRPGMLNNSIELAKLFTVTKSIMENPNLKLFKISGLDFRDAVKADDSNIIGYNLYAGKSTPVKISQQDRYSHTYVLGDIGEGKSVLLSNQAVQDIRAGHGVLVIDPHGPLVNAIIPQIPEHRIEDVIPIDFSQKDYVPRCNTFNLFSSRTAGRASDDLTLLYKKLFPQTGKNQQNILHHTFYTYCSLSDLKLSDLKTLLSRSKSGEKFRNRIIGSLTNETSIQFWKEEFYTFNKATISSIFSILDSLLLNDTVAPIFSQSDCVLDFSAALSGKKIILVKIPIGSIGQDAASIIGASMLTAFYVATMERADLPPSEIPPPFFGYVDELSRFRTRTVDDLLVEARKYRVGLTVALQHKGMVREDLQKTLGNCRTLISFRLDYDAARDIVGNFMEKVEKTDLLSLPVGFAISRVNNEVVTVKTLPPFEVEDNDVAREIRRRFRGRYSIKRSDLESDLRQQENEKPQKIKRIIDTF